MISLANVSAGYGSQPVLQEVTLRVAQGEFVGLIGPNGCGKTTLLRVISGVLAARIGEVRLQGTDLQAIPRRTLARTLACLLQDLTLDLPFTVREVVLMGRTPHLPRFGRESARDFEVAERAIERADLAPLADRLVTEISGGER
jgi:iron complex transport system ATP-binding protein